MKKNRSRTALEADTLQEQLVYRGRVFQLWGWIILLALGIGIAKWQAVASIYILAGIAAWIVCVLHLNFTQVLHELYEINDQIAGRKDELKNLLRREAGNLT